MALDKATLIIDLTAIFTDTSGTKTATQAAQEIADAIDKYVKTGSVAFGAGTITGADVPSGDTHNGLTATNGTIS